MIPNDQIAVLLIVIIFLFGVVLVWIKIMATSQIRENRELTDDLERILRKDIQEGFEKSQAEMAKKLELMKLEIDTKLGITHK